MDKQVYESLKKEKNPIYIYGAGNLAHQIYRKMQQYGITIAGAVTDSGDEKFILEEGEDSVNVYKLSALISNASPHSIAIIEGFASAYEKRLELLKNEAFSNVYELAIPFDHHAHFDEKWVVEKRDKLELVKGMLEDDYSRKVFDAFINAVLWESADYVRDVFEKEMSHFDNDVIEISRDEIFLDVGAYRGGSIAGFLKASGGTYKKIIGIEPEEDNYQALKQFCIDNTIEAELYNIGCWCEKETLCFEADNEISRLSQDGEVKIEVDRIDNILGLDNKITLINMGVSVSEKEIIEGAEGIIKKYKPKWVIYMGAAREELYEIPILMKKIMPSYKLYFRYIQAMPSRMFLFAK